MPFSIQIKKTFTLILAGCLFSGMLQPFTANAIESESSPNPFNQVSDELMLYLASFLNPVSLTRVAQTDRRWRNIAQDKNLKFIYEGIDSNSIYFVAGQGFNCILIKGKLNCIGSFKFDDHKTFQLDPKQINRLNGHYFSEVTATPYSLFAVAEDGSLFTWGRQHEEKPIELPPPEGGKDS